MLLPDDLRAQVASFGETPSGAYRVTLALSDGPKVFNVVVSDEGEILQVGSRVVEDADDLSFDAQELTGVIPGWAPSRFRSPYSALALTTGALSAMSLLTSWRLIASGVPLLESMASDWGQVAFSSFLGLSLAFYLYRPRWSKGPEPVWWRLAVGTAAVFFVVEGLVLWTMGLGNTPPFQLAAAVNAALLALPILVAAILGVRRERSAAILPSNKGISVSP